jgi:hypothetical protein
MFNHRHRASIHLWDVDHRVSISTVIYAKNRTTLKIHVSEQGAKTRKMRGGKLYAVELRNVVGT